MKGSTDRIENIPYTLVLHNNVYVLDTIFVTMPVILVKNPMGKWLELITIAAYQASAGDTILSHEPVSYLWPYA